MYCLFVLIVLSKTVCPSKDWRWKLASAIYTDTGHMTLLLLSVFLGASLMQELEKIKT